MKRICNNCNKTIKRICQLKDGQCWLVCPECKCKRLTFPSPFACERCPMRQDKQ